jgi:hypothetical protein
MGWLHMHKLPTTHNQQQQLLKFRMPKCHSPHVLEALSAALASAA